MKRNVRYSRNLNVATAQPGAVKGEKSKKKKLFSFKKIIRPVVIILAILLLAYAVIVSSLFKISTIDVEGTNTLSGESVRNQAQNVITSSPLTQNIIFAPTDKIAEELQKQNYQIAKAEVSRSGLNSILIKITEQKPSILWQSGNTLSIIAANGHAYDGDITEEMRTKLITVIDTTNLPVKKGEKVVLEQFVDFVNAVKEQIPNKGLTVKQFQIAETTTELIVQTEAGYYLRFDTTRDVGEQMQDLSAVLGQLKKAGKKPAEYIDLRINGKVFYK